MRSLMEKIIDGEVFRNTLAAFQIKLSEFSAHWGKTESAIRKSLYANGLTQADFARVTVILRDNFAIPYESIMSSFGQTPAPTTTDQVLIAQMQKLTDAIEKLIKVIEENGSSQ